MAMCIIIKRKQAVNESYRIVVGAIGANRW